MESGAYTNFVAKFSYEDRLETLGLDYVSFPVDLRIIGYHVCFVNAQKEEAVTSAKTLEDSRKFPHGQAVEWSDVQILRASGFIIVEAPTYENLFSMLAAGRFDLFCRGANELEKEWRAHRHIPDLANDKSIVIYCPCRGFAICIRTTSRR